MVEFKDRIEALTNVIAHLRNSESGCPSDYARDPQKTLHYLELEIEEFLSASEGEEMDHIESEAGDILFNVLFYAAQMGENLDDVLQNPERVPALFVTNEQLALLVQERKIPEILERAFIRNFLASFARLCENNKISTIRAVQRGVKKMIYRHPHVFDKPKQVSEEEAAKIWKRMKAKETLEEGRRLTPDFEKRECRVPLFVQNSQRRIIDFKNVDPAQLREILSQRQFENYPMSDFLVDCDQDAFVLQTPVEGEEFRRIKSFNEIERDFESEISLSTVAIQDAHSQEILIVGYVNPEALEITFKSGLATLWSTSRHELWTKGKGSGNTLKETEVFYSDQSGALVYRVVAPERGACHTVNLYLQERTSCFYRKLDGKRQIDSSYFLTFMDDGK